MTTITGTISRRLDDGRHVEIPFSIDAATGTYSQWGHATLTLGANVELLEALRDALRDTS